MILFPVLGTLLQWRFGKPDDMLSLGLLHTAAVLPVELYILPRYLLYMDSQAVQSSHNLPDKWQATFESRWLHYILAKLILFFLVSLGVIFLVLPGVVVLLLLGFFPYFVLLRGESLSTGWRKSALMSARYWTYILRVALPLAALYGMLLFSFSYIENTHFPNLPLQASLLHPGLWLMRLGASLFEVLVSLWALSLFHQVEKLPLPALPTKGEH